MDSTAHFLVNPRLTRLLGETYRSSEAALKELIDNAWDADAQNVWVTLPTLVSSSPIVIQDDGLGMSEQAVRNEYLDIASDKRKRMGERSPVFGRKIKGRKGIGKFAGLTVAGIMTLESSTKDEICRLRIDKRELINNENDLENIPLNFTTSLNETQSVGTKISLEELDQSLNFPQEEAFKELIVREYGREEKFAVYVNGLRVSFNDLRGASVAAHETFSDAGSVEVNFTISEDKSRPRSPGLSLRVGGKIVGPPSFFGLDEDDEIPRKLLKNLAGEISVPENDSFVTADWGAVNESSKAYQEVKSYVQGVIKGKLKETHTNQMNLQRARLKKALDKRLQSLPENRRHYAEHALSKILNKFYGESDEKIKVIADVALDAMELDGYWSVLEKINDASVRDVHDFAESLQDFGILELSNVGRQARSRRQFLGFLENLASDDKTKEDAMHTALEKNLWVFGHRYSQMSSNETLAKIVEKYCDKKYKGSKAKNRPDLLLTQGFDGRYLLIEFKRPSKIIGRDEISQAEEYRDELSTQLHSGMSFEIMVVGKGRKANVSVENLAQNISIHSYVSLISTARLEVDWLLDALRK
jgi:hypothetical protein